MPFHHAVLLVFYSRVRILPIEVNITCNLLVLCRYHLRLWVALALFMVIIVDRVHIEPCRVFGMAH